MIAYSSFLAERPTIFYAPMSLLLRGIMSDVPRYEKCKFDSVPRYIGIEGTAKRQDKIHDFVVSLLEEHGPMTTNEIAYHSCHSRGAAHSYMSRMLTAGLVKRVIIGRIYTWELV